MGKIVISYRRADATDAAGRIFDRLVADFGHGTVFKDVDSIPVGSDFAEVIAEQLEDCMAVIVVIGRSWLTARGRDGKPRLHDPRDFVHMEVEHALNSRALVIPALVGNAAMPGEAQLPQTLRGLARKNAISIRPDPDFHRDMDRLVRGLREHFNQSRRPRRARPPERSRKAAAADGAPATLIQPGVRLGKWSLRLAVVNCVLVPTVLASMYYIGEKMGQKPENPAHGAGKVFGLFFLTVITMWGGLVACGLFALVGGLLGIAAAVRGLVGRCKPGFWRGTAGAAAHAAMVVALILLNKM